MADCRVIRHWDHDRSRLDHNLMLASSSLDDYRSETLHCTGASNPYEVEDGREDPTCRWLGPNIPPGRWHEKHVSDAFERHVADVAEHGPLVHGRDGERCRCYYCRHGQTAEEMRNQA